MSQRGTTIAALHADMNLKVQEIRGQREQLDRREDEVLNAILREDVKYMTERKDEWKSNITSICQAPSKPVSEEYAKSPVKNETSIDYTEETDCWKDDGIEDEDWAILQLMIKPDQVASDPIGHLRTPII